VQVELGQRISMILIQVKQPAEVTMAEIHIYHLLQEPRTQQLVEVVEIVEIELSLQN
jgi:hypothetical protein